MSPALQVKLLRVLQERELERIGGQGQVIPLDVRLMAATNQDLEAMVKEGSFREDLYYRINVITVSVPPLRDRPEDIELLAGSFCSRYTARNKKHFRGLAPEALAKLRRHRWPGNVRELENVMLRVLMLTPSGSLITPKVLSRKLVEILEPIGHGSSPDETLRQAVERVEAWLIRRALANNGGRKMTTARRLGLTREGPYN
jgi:two-component system response regulator AtoC